MPISAGVSFFSPCSNSGARSFEGQGFRGLFDFVRLLRGMLEQGEDFQTVGAEATGGAVERAEQYRPQLAAYARAVHEIYGRPVRACVLYFFHTGDTEWVSLDED